jgi:hypothetical protein
MQVLFLHGWTSVGVCVLISSLILSAAIAYHAKVSTANGTRIEMTVRPTSRRRQRRARHATVVLEKEEKVSGTCQERS